MYDVLSETYPQQEQFCMQLDVLPELIVITYQIKVRF